MKPIIFLALAAFAVTASGATYKCTVNGSTVYSQTRCAAGEDEVEVVHVDPVPTDSLDNPETALRYQAMKNAEAQMELERQKLQLEQQRLQVERDTQRQQMKMQQDLADQAQGIGTGATFGIHPNPSAALRQQSAMKALRAINGVPEAPTIVVPPPPPPQPRSMYCVGNGMGGMNCN